MNLPEEIVNHIFSYCQSRTNVIMKEHLKCLDQVFQDEIYHSTILDIKIDCQSSHLPYVLHLMGFYGQIHFNKDLFYSRYYCCANCRRVGYAPPVIEFGEKFCNSYCVDMFDY